MRIPYNEWDKIEEENGDSICAKQALRQQQTTKRIQQLPNKQTTERN